MAECARIQPRTQKKVRGVQKKKSTGAGYLKKHGDDAKSKKHALHVQAAGARFLPASFSVLGALGACLPGRPRHALG
eukprot:scaffold10979_cov124-Isochrysis_galbana.AAC.4